MSLKTSTTLACLKLLLFTTILFKDGVGDEIGIVENGAVASLTSPTTGPLIDPEKSRVIVLGLKWLKL
mgnify:CR=1 FL=1